MMDATERLVPAASSEVAARPGVTVVITTYNHAHFLGEALASARGQSHAPDEVIVVDDGSTDDPAAVVACHVGVRLIRQRNRGLAAARNTGWRATSTRFVVFLDADDRLLPDALVSNLRRFEEQPESAFVYGGYRWIDVGGRVLRTVPPQAIGTDAYEAFLRGNQIGMHATVMYRRDCIEEAGGFDERLRACEDYDLYLRIARLHRVAFSPGCLAEYRQHDSNMSGNLPLMLRSTLGVLRQQGPSVSCQPRWAAAYRQGLRNWKQFYVGTQLQAWRTLPRRQIRSSMVIATVRLFRLAPQAYLRIGLRAAVRRIRACLPRRPTRGVDLGDLRRITPLGGRDDRGRPIDRRFIESFLARQADDIRGRVLEIGDNGYASRFGGERVIRTDVMRVCEGDPEATLTGDLADGFHLPPDSFDCILLTQTLEFALSLEKAVASLCRLLRPGGVLLVTVPGVSSVDRGERSVTWYWSFTSASLRRLLERCFPAAKVQIEVYGNVLAAVASLHGLADHELEPGELDAQDPRYPVIVAARAVKEASPDAGSPAPV